MDTLESNVGTVRPTDVAGRTQPRSGTQVVSRRRVIEAQRGWLRLNWAEIWRFRELLYFLAWRDVKIRYRQTVLGVAWAVLQPLSQMAVFSLFFGRLAGLADKTDGVPYPLYVFAGLLPWTFFSTAVSQSSASVLSSARMITKVYFPRLIIPLSSVGAALVDLCISFFVLLGLMLYFRHSLSWQLLLLPVLIVTTLMTATGVGAALSALTVSFRDFKYVVPFLIQLWMFVTPVIYPTSIVPGRWRWIMMFNPVAGVIDGFRAAFLGLPLDWHQLGIAVTLSASVFVLGTSYFRSQERGFADVI